MRNNWPDGTRLRLQDGTEYTIKSASNVGGTAIIYFADKQGSGIRTVLKEFFPLDWVRRNGVPVHPEFSDQPTGNADLLNDYETLQALARRELKISQAVASQVYNVPPHRALLDVQSIREPDGTEWVPDSLADGSRPRWVLEMDDLNHVDSRWIRDILREAMEPESEQHPLGARRPGTRPSLAVPPLPVTLDIIKALLDLLAKVHRAGYLHGDINLGNVLLITDHTGRKIQDVRLLDFGSARPLLDDGQTAPLGSDPVLATPGFCAPELSGGGEQRLSPAADVYSVGKLLHCLLDKYALRTLRQVESAHDDASDMLDPSERELQLESDRQFFVSRLESDTLDPSGIYDSRISPDVKTKLDAILLGAAKTDQEKRSTVEQMLEQVRQLRRRFEPLEWRVSLGLPELNGNEVLGRDNDIQAIEQELQKHSTLVVHGFSGIGKTKLVTALGHDYQQRYPFTQVYYAFFPGSMLELVTGSLAEGIGIPTTKKENNQTVPRKAAEIIKDVFQALNQNMREDDLLIIDNVDDDTQRSWSAMVHEDTTPGQTDLFTRLCALQCRVVFVTRMDISDMNGIVPYQAGKLELEPLRDILRRYSVPADEDDTARCSDEKLNALIELVERHTMTVDMIARTLHHSQGLLTVDDLSQELRDSNFDSELFPEIAGDKAGDYAQRRIEGHLRCLFRLTQFNEKEQDILRCAQLIGESYGMSKELFLTCCPHTTKAESIQNAPALEHLMKLGYLRQEKPANRKVFLRLHTLVRVVAKKEVPLDAGQADAFLDGMPRAYRRYIGRVAPENIFSVAETYTLALGIVPHGTFLSGYLASCAAAWYFNARSFSNLCFIRMVEYLTDAIPLYKALQNGTPVPSDIPDAQKRLVELYWNLWDALSEATPGLVRKNCGTTALARKYWTVCLDEPERNLQDPALFPEYQKCGEFRAELREKLRAEFQPETFDDFWAYTDISEPEEQVRVGKALLDRVEKKSIADYEKTIRVRGWIVDSLEKGTTAHKEQAQMLVQEHERLLTVLAQQTPMDAEKFADTCYAAREVCQEELGDANKGAEYAERANRVELNFIEHPEQYSPIQDPMNVDVLCLDVLHQESDWANDTKRALSIYYRILLLCQSAMIDLEKLRDHPRYAVTLKSLLAIIHTVKVRLGKNAPETPHEQQCQEICRLYVEKVRRRLPSPEVLKKRTNPQPKSTPTEQEVFLTALRSGTISTEELIAYRQKFFAELNSLRKDFVPDPQDTLLREIPEVLAEIGNYAEQLNWLEDTIRLKLICMDQNNTNSSSVSDTSSPKMRAEFYRKHFSLEPYYERAIHVAQQIGDKARAAALAEEMFRILSADRETVTKYSLDWETDDILHWTKACSLYAGICCAQKEYIRASRIIETALADVHSHVNSLNEQLKNSPPDDPDGFLPSYAASKIAYFQDNSDALFDFLVQQQEELKKLLPKHHPLLTMHERLEIAFCRSGKTQKRLCLHNAKEMLLAQLHDWDSWWEPEG